MGGHWSRSSAEVQRRLLEEMEDCETLFERLRDLGFDEDEIECFHSFSLGDIMDVVTLRRGDVAAALTEFEFEDSTATRLRLLRALRSELERVQRKINHERKTKSASQPSRHRKRQGPSLRGEAKAKRGRKHAVGPEDRQDPPSTARSNMTAKDFDDKLDIDRDGVGDDQADVLRLYGCKTLREAITFPDGTEELYIDYLNLLKVRCLLCEKNLVLHSPANTSMIFQHIRGAKHKQNYDDILNRHQAETETTARASKKRGVPIPASDAFRFNNSLEE